MVDGPVAGEDRAAEEGGVGERDAVGGGQHAVGGDDGLLREGRDVQPGVEAGAVRRTGVEAGGALEGVGAEPDLADPAVEAGPAGGGPVEDHAVAGRDVGDALADRQDRTGALMAEDGGHRDAHGAVGQGQVGVADPGGGERDAHLAGPGSGRTMSVISSGAPTAGRTAARTTSRLPGLFERVDGQGRYGRGRGARWCGGGPGRTDGVRARSGAPPVPGERAQNWSDLVWRYSARPCGPSSRPTPDCL